MLEVIAARNPAYSAADHSSIDLLVTFKGLGELPFTAHRDDTEEHGLQIYTDAAAGAYGAVGAYVAPTPAVPQTVAMWQAKAALQATAFAPTPVQEAAFPSLTGAANLLAAASALVAAENNEVLTAFWTGAASIDRSSPTLASIAGTLGLTSTQVDALFMAAAAISL